MSALATILGEEVAIEIGGRVVTLSPTLGAAMRVAALDPDGFGGVVARLADEEFALCGAIIGAGARSGTLIDSVDLWNALCSGDLTDALRRFVLVLANGGEPLRPVEASAGKAGGPTLSHDEFHVRLFRLATGWLGWTPDEALEAPMPAIVAAYAGRLDMLRALFGGAEPTPARNDLPLDEKFRMAFAGARKVERPTSTRATSEGSRAASPTT